MSGPAGPAVSVDGLVVRFGELAAVDGVSFAVEQGEVFGLLGPNGAGKTTTLRVLTTLLRPTSGRATVAGHDTIAAGLHVRAAIGYVPQAISVDAALTGLENLAFYARVAGIPRAERRERIARSVETMGLEPFVERLAIMDLGRLAAQGSPQELREAYEAVSLDDVFAAATGRELEEGGGSFRDVRRQRRLSRRLG